MSFLRFLGMAVGAAFICFILPYATLLLAVNFLQSMGLFGLLLAFLTGLWVIWAFINWVLK